MAPTVAPRRSRLAERSGKLDAKSSGINDFTGLLVLRSSRRKSARFSCRINHLDRPLVLRGPEQDSTEMAEKIGPHDAERVLREIPRQLGQGRWQRQGQDDGLGLLSLQAAALDAMGDEVIRIASTPRGLRPCASRNLTGWRRARTLPTTHAPVWPKPVAADAARPLCEHPEMLASLPENQSGPFLASNPGSILASAEDWLRYRRNRMGLCSGPGAHRLF